MQRSPYGTSLPGAGTVHHINRVILSAHKRLPLLTQHQTYRCIALSAVKGHNRTHAVQHERIQEDRLAQAVSKLIHQGNVENKFLQRGIKPDVRNIVRSYDTKFSKTISTRVARV